MRLHTYFRSSAAYRVRIALNFKGLPYEAVPVHLVKGEQQSAEYRAMNPSALVPSFEDEGAAITQSMAIIEYLEETYTEVPLLPGDALGRARVRELAMMIGCDIHPLNNLRVLRYLVRKLGVDDEAKNAWYRHWIAEGFGALEAQLAKSVSRFCVGDTPTIADCFLVPQVYNAKRFDIDVSPYPTIARIDAACAELLAFIAAHPSQQPDSE